MLAVVGLWFGLVAWRPLALGFYHDDWWSIALPVQLTPLKYVFDQDPSRGVYVVLVWCLRALFGSSAAAWQLLAAVTNLACALLICALVDRLGRGGEAERTGWASAVAGAAWLAAPWSLAYAAWPIMAMPLLSVALLAGSAVVLLPWRCSAAAAGGAALLFLTGAAIYEAVWGAFVPVALMAGLSRLRAGAPLPPVLVYAVVAAVGQIALLALNRMLSVAGTGKAISGAVLDLIGNSLKSAPGQMSQSIGEPLLPVVLLSLAVLAAGFILAIWHRRDWTACAYLGACALGVLIAAMLHAAAGYTIAWKDLMGRTAMAPSFWFAVAIGVALRTILAGTRALRLSGALAGVGLLAALSVAILVQSREWAQGWREQQAVLSSFPIGEAERLTPGTFIVADLPRDGTPRGQFDAFWDIGGALLARYPQLAPLLFTPGAHATVLRPEDWWTEFDGAKLSQGWCFEKGRALWSLAASEVLVWRQRTGDFVKLPQGVRIGCGAGPPQ